MSVINTNHTCINRKLEYQSPPLESDDGTNGIKSLTVRICTVYTYYPCAAFTGLQLSVVDPTLIWKYSMHMYAFEGIYIIIATTRAVDHINGSINIGCIMSEYLLYHYIAVCPFLFLDEE